MRPEMFSVNVPIPDTIVLLRRKKVLKYFLSQLHLYCYTCAIDFHAREKFVLDKMNE